MRSNTDAFNTNARSQFSIEVTTYDLNGLLGFRVVLDCSSSLVDMMVSVHSVEKEHTHQQYTLVVDCDRRCYGTFMDVVCPINSSSPLLV